MFSNFCLALYATLRAAPEQVCLVWPRAAGSPVRLTGRQVLAQAEALRAQLRDQLVPVGQAVVVALPVSPELLTTLLGIMAHGAVPVLPPAGSRHHLAGLLLRSRYVMLPAGPARRWQWLGRRLGIRVLAAPAAGPAAECLPPTPVAVHAQAALVSHSSGSTGRPKAIRRTHAVLMAQHQVLRRLFPPQPDQRDFPLFPNILLHNLSVGTPSVLPAVPWGRLADFDPAGVARQLQQEGVTTLTGNVFYLQRLSRYLLAEGLAVPEVQAVGVGGSPVPEYLLHQLRRCFPQAAVYAIYGSSEAEPIALRQATATAPPAGLTAGLAAGYYVGPVVDGLECRLLPHGEVWRPGLPPVPVGEVAVRGPHVAAPNWLATGDYGYFDTQGHLWLTGRRGNATICAGVQHYQVEHVVQHVPGVERVAARPRRGGFAVYVQGTACPTAVRAALAAHLPPGVCRALVFRALPVDARHLSKILYDRLP